MIDLTKGPADMSNNGKALTRVVLEFTWSLSGGGQKGLMGKLNRLKGVDLDASVLAYDANNVALAAAYFDNLEPAALMGAVRHMGDARGRGGSSSEKIQVDLERMPSDIHTLVCVLSSYKGASFASVNDAIFRMSDMSDDDQTPIGRVVLPIQGNDNAAVMAVIRRKGNSWTINEVRKTDRVFGNDWKALTSLTDSVVKAA